MTGSTDRADCEVHHPGVQHSALTAAALDRVGRLAKLVTRLQLGSDPTPPWSWLLRTGSGQRALARRTHEFLPDDRIERVCGGYEVLLKALNRTISSQAISSRARAVVDERFQRKSIAGLCPTTRFLVCTEGAAGAPFQLLAERNDTVRRVLDVAHPHGATALARMRADMDANGFGRESYDDQVGEDRARMAVLDREIAFANVVLVASSFTARSLTDAGTPPAKIHVVPYGLPSNSRRALDSSDRTDELSLVFVGALSERKGVSMLLRTMTELYRQRAPIALTIIGGRAANVDLRIPANTRHVRAHSREQLEGIVARAHYLVLPSICEGFGRVLIEALSLGTGIITTEASAGPDLVFEHPDAPIKIIPVSERAALGEVLLRTLDELNTIGLDRVAAAAAGRSYTLEAYGQRLNDVLQP